MKLFLETGESVIVAEDAFSSGGEGEVRRVITSPSKYSNTCAKIYFKSKRTKLQENKLRYMVLNPPARVKGAGFFIGWPLGLLFDDKKKFIGFIMPLAPTDSKELVNLTAIKISNKLSPEWHQRFDRSNGTYALLSRLKLMKNIAIPLHLLHSTGKYVLGDFKPQNVLVTYSGTITLIDMDSIQICEEEKLLYPFTASTDFYMPPEYYSDGVGRNKSIINISWDNFAISVVFYQLLFGLHPYVVTPKNIKDDTSSEIPQNIKNNLFPFGENSKNIESFPEPHNKFLRLPDKIQRLFKCAFSKYPNNRPNVEDWGKILNEEIMKCPPVSAPPIPKPTPDHRPKPKPTPKPTTPSAPPSIKDGILEVIGAIGGILFKVLIYFLIWGLIVGIIALIFT